jgi:hypothetical protein
MALTAYAMCILILRHSSVLYCYHIVLLTQLFRVCLTTITAAAIAAAAAAAVRAGAA